MIVNQPGGEEFLIAAKLDDPDKEDLDSRPRELRASSVARARVAYAMTEDTPALEGYLWREMQVGGSTAQVLFNTWKSHRNSQARIQRWFRGLNSAVRNTPGFLEVARRFEARVQANLRAQHRAGTVDYHDLVTGAGPVRDSFDGAAANEQGRATSRMLPNLVPPYVSLSLFDDTAAKICIGSIQGIRISIKDFRAAASPPAYAATLKYELRDHFGVDDSDCEISADGLHGTPGQVAMWVLQHHRRPGHLPWITVVYVERDISGSLA